VQHFFHSRPLARIFALVSGFGVPRKKQYVTQVISNVHGDIVARTTAPAFIEHLLALRPVLQSGIEMPYRAIKANIAESLNVLVQIVRRPGQRHVSEVLEIQGYDSQVDHYQFHPSL